MRTGRDAITSTLSDYGTQQHSDHIEFYVHLDERDDAAAMAAMANRFLGIQTRYAKECHGVNLLERNWLGRFWPPRQVRYQAAYAPTFATPIIRKYLLRRSLARGG